MNGDLESKIEEAIKNPRNLGEMKDADAVGTVGSADCGDMLRMWIKFKEENGRQVIDRATFQSFGCQTAIAVASVATQLLKGKTPDGRPFMRLTGVAVAPNGDIYATDGYLTSYVHRFDHAGKYMVLLDLLLDPAPEAVPTATHPTSPLAMIEQGNSFRSATRLLEDT